jgi:hypothetical protein
VDSPPTTDVKWDKVHLPFYIDKKAPKKCECFLAFHKIFFSLKLNYILAGSTVQTFFVYGLKKASKMVGPKWCKIHSSKSAGAHGLLSLWNKIKLTLKNEN